MTAQSQPGDIFLVSGHGIEDRLIQFAQRRRDGGQQSTWSHAAVIVSQNGHITGNLRLIEAAGTHGVRYANASDYAHVHTQVFSVTATDTQRAAAVAVAKSKLGVRYDWQDLIGIGLNLLFGDPFQFHSDDHKLICSWLCSLCLQAEGYALPRPACNMSPGDLAWLLSPHVAPRPAVHS